MIHAATMGSRMEILSEVICLVQEKLQTEW